MCTSVRFTHNNTKQTVNLSDPDAVLPVRLKSKDHGIIPWGNHTDEAAELPAGGLAKHESILEGDWDKFFPKPVLITVDHFMMKDHKGNYHWHQLTGSSYLQGLIATDGNYQSVCVVTIEAEEDDIYEYWPRIVNSI